MTQKGYSQKSLRKKVYDFIREQMNDGKLLPGSLLNLQETSSRLGISMTPLREALVQLETEGFVTIIPRRGVVINTLTLTRIRQMYRVIGALEAAALEDVYQSLTEGDIERLQDLNRKMREDLEKGEMEEYMSLNRTFHNTWLGRCGNEELFRIAQLMKDRLYEFPRNVDLVPEWEEVSMAEHETIVECLLQKDLEGAVYYLRDVHWCFNTQEAFVRKYYAKHLERLDHMRKDAVELTL
ncbi:MAG TPA: GntR family transcriptional regulator [Synergistaceae bacterium]|jgi:DNA-binding GntR family transcriptional regulator|nr:MAG: Transcriptional regulator, GntR family [Synergistales bacterium 53_16]KUL01188.1 MAG: Transcriptional regulator, GntR family [Synergistales bacterium 54_9]MDK2846382.1 hypothetical protein [Synergistales bacterium]HAA46924.1 GntR family transcriptional regulator [Synergistaceae bacterium]MDN5336744.1 hypothetical protein [Synergistales bacterium]